MSTKRRVRKSEVDTLLEGLSVGEKIPVTSTRGYWKNRQSLFHGKFPKRHVALIKHEEDGVVKYTAERIK